MAFLVRCPVSYCRRPKRVDGELTPRGGAPVCECPNCRVYFAAWVDPTGVSIAVELQPGVR